MKIPTHYIALAITCILILSSFFGCTYETRADKEKKQEIKEVTKEPTSTRYVKCYSGGKLIYEGKTTDSWIITSTKSPWMDFEDSETLLKVYVNADCVVKYQQEKYLVK